MALAALATCLDNPAVQCVDGRLCAPGTVCSPRGDCVLAEQLDTCRDKPDFTPCSYPRVPDGICARDVCVPAIPVCGDGFVDPDVFEACDDGPDNADTADAACRTNCQPRRCGDGIEDTDEVCDDGNLAAGDGCTPDCQSIETCGNGYIDFLAGELCDDGNVLSHDGCASQCLPELPAWTEPSFGIPSKRRGHAMVYHAARGRVVLFSGYTGRYPNDTWEWNGIRWIEVTPATGSPAGREFHAMAYDARRDRIVLFGGDDFEDGGGGERYNDTWEWDGARWIEITPTTGAPSARERHAMAYDPVRERVVLFGGDDASPGFSLSDTWEWDGVRWTEVTPKSGSPPAMSGHAMIYDPARERIVLHGNGMWEWDGAQWTQVQLSAINPPPTTSGHAMAYDAVRERLVIFTNGTWEWDGSQWSYTPPVMGWPEPRTRHTMAYDTARHRVVMFGGFTGGRLNDTWEWDGVRWTQLQLPSSSAVERDAHAMAYDPLRGRVVMFGGNDGDLLNDTWEWDGVQWIESAPAKYSPPAREHHALVYDESCHCVVLFGGSGQGGISLNDTWEWNGVSWTEVTPVSGSPPGRKRHSMAYDATRSRVVMFGGVGGGFPNDTWEWDGAAWTEITAPTGSSPDSRLDHAMAYDPGRGRVMMFGGYGKIAELNDTLEWDGTQWIRSSPVTVPPARRSRHEMAYDPVRRRIVLVGGVTGFTDQLYDLWEWDGAQWVDVTPIASPFPAIQHEPIIYDAARSRFVVFAGDNGGGAADAWRLQYENRALPDDSCLYGFDTDGDDLIGCDDPDCWGYCSPLCPPQAKCDPAAPRCGDGVCNAYLETCRLCPQDCGACSLICGDFLCDPGETTASCPVDCPAQSASM